MLSQSGTRSVRPAGPHTIRLSPPLTISEDDLAHGLGVLEEVLAA